MEMGEGRGRGRAIPRRRFLALAGMAVGAAALGGSRPGLRFTGTATEILMRSDRAGARVWFEPAGVIVRPGGTVSWRVAEGVHTATAYHPLNGRPLRMPADAAPWDSGYLTEPGETFAVRLDHEGVYDFFCRPHEAAGMVGRILVLAQGRRPEEISEPSYPDRSTGASLPPAALDALPSVRSIRCGTPTREGEK